MDVSGFRTNFPEFSNTSTYPDVSVQIWLTVGKSLVNEARWMELTDIGISLVAAHHLAIAASDAAVAVVGGIPGQSSGPVTAKSVDKVSKSNDTSAITLDDAGFWNMTSYGMRYLKLARHMGAGGMQF
jgi:hypothetical protein